MGSKAAPLLSHLDTSPENFKRLFLGLGAFPLKAAARRFPYRGKKGCHCKQWRRTNPQPLTTQGRQRAAPSLFPTLGGSPAVNEQLCRLRTRLGWTGRPADENRRLMLSKPGRAVGAAHDCHRRWHGRETVSSTTNPLASRLLCGSQAREARVPNWPWR